MLNDNQINEINSSISIFENNDDPEMGAFIDNLIDKGFSSELSYRLNSFVYSKNSGSEITSVGIEKDDNKSWLVGYDDLRNEVKRDDEILIESRKNMAVNIPPSESAISTLRPEGFTASIEGPDQVFQSEKMGAEHSGLGAVFENDGNYELARGIPLEDDLNFDRVKDFLLDKGVRFSANNKETGKGETFLAMNDNMAETLKLYDKNGSIVELDSNRAIKIVDGSIFLVPKVRDYNYQTVEASSRSSTAEVGMLPPLPDDASDEEKKRREEARSKGRGRGGFNLFPGRSNKAKPNSSSSGIDLSSVNNPAFIGGVLMSDISKARKLMESINEAGGPMSDFGKDNISKFYDVMDRVQSGFEGLDKSNFDLREMSNFDELRDSVENFRESARDMKGFIFDGDNLMDSPALKSMNESIKNAISRVAASFGGSREAS
ncbi:MAG: hypothetical protein RPS47_04735 [Colwellia sp.]|jgi:hypothetical protein